ncbi:sensor histidine kinase [Pontibacillus yanchengensis]|uniref:Heme sensor protein HssS n=1 Tax=Pontibacillus yanchengensis Y32 TaxID=1385514 RepID=A0A0A2TAB1_9BACI|nr:HAMP domain-containing sensor histidine kinase [Pontibacillus yanchengensis]KGP72762.1 membrane protein [Pontibacillus yanchengensis Y32]
MKSLYVQIVVTFLGAVLISLFISFLISGKIYEYQVSERIQNRMEQVGKDFIQLYKSSPNMEVDTYLDAMSSFSFDVLVYRENNKSLIYENKPSSWNLSQETINKVINGGVYKHKSIPPRSVVGLPFEMQGSSYAMFIRPDFTFFFKDFRKVMLILFSTILVLGSIIFIITTRWTIRPIKKLTYSTKQVAKGNFDVAIETKRKDELGDLTRSFNHMVHGLDELDDMRQQFVSNVSHEIQSPLTSIQGFAKALKDDVIQDEQERKEYLSIIEHESKRLSSLSQNLLKLATLDTDHPPFHPIDYALDEQLRRVVASLEPQWSAKEQDVHIDIEDTTFKGDQDQLEQVWINLLTNAIRYTPFKGEIYISTKSFDEKIVVSITDSGIGISEEEQFRVFERFYKVDKSRSRNKGGNGLGLSIAQKIVLLHHGWISIESEPGEGATFHVHLPKTIEWKD